MTASSPPDDLPSRLLLRWTRLLAGHRYLLAIFLILQAVVFSAFSAWIFWQPDVLQFFSADSAEVRNLRQVAATPGPANQLRFDVHFAGPPQPDEQAALSAFTRDLAARLTASHQFTSVWCGADETALASAYARLLTQAPLLLTSQDRERLDSHLTSEFLQARFAEVREHLADPDGEFLARQLAADPLNLSPLITAKLQSLSPSGAASPSFHDGLLMTRDSDSRWHAMIVTQPVSLPSNQKAAEATLAAANLAIAQTRAQSPAAGAAQVWLVGAHRGYVENARRIITDVSRVSILGTLAVLLAIALYFRRLAPALLCMIPPMVGVGLALGLAGIFHVTLPLLLLGFAGLLCGSTTDYGIQIIARSRRLFLDKNSAWHPDIPANAARHMLGPISMSVATSVTGFAALALSSAPGLRALGLFVAAATLCIWLVTFLILPACLGPWILPKQKSVDAAAPQPPTSFKKFLTPALTLAFLALTACLLFASLHVRFNSNPRSLDGSPPSLRSDENNFAKVWGDPRNHAIVLVTAPTPGEALTQLAHVNRYLLDQQTDGLIGHVTSPAAILPDSQTLADRAAAWKIFWTPARKESLQKNLAAAAAANAFKPAPFLAYVSSIDHLAPQPSAARLADSPAQFLPGLIQQSADSTTLAAIVEMRADLSLRRSTAWAPELRMRYPQTIILGGNILFFDATDRARAEGERLLPLCILAILLPLIIYFRRLTTAWLVLGCLLVGLIWVTGAAAYFAGGLNLLSLVPLLFTLGVAVDYGIYLTPRTPQSPRGLLGPSALCALTTLLGSVSLIFAVHPAMRWLGITLAAGITGGFLTAALLVRPLTHRPRASRPKKFLPTLRFLSLNAALALFTLLLVIPVLAEFLLAHEIPAGTTANRAYPALLQTAPRTFTAGPSWMQWQPATPTTGLWKIKLVGGPFDRGDAVAKLASPIDFRIETEMLDQLDTLVPDEWARWIILRSVGANMLSLSHYVPLEYQQEIWASAVGGSDPHKYLAPSYPRILSYHALHDISQMLIDNPLIVPNDFACTGVVSLPRYSSNDPHNAGHLWLARNFDFEGGESFGRQKSLTFVIPPKNAGYAFAHVAWPGLAGCVTGINEKRIALFLNAAATSDFRRIGTPTILMARDILQHAASIPEAEKIIRSTQVFVSDIIVIADGNTGQSTVFEKSPAATSSYPVDDSTVVTNHLVTPRFASDPVNKDRIENSTTMQRYTRARELLDAQKNAVTPLSLAALLRDKKGPAGKDLGLGNRNAIDGLIACHAVIIDATTAQMWIAAWPNAEGPFLHFDILKELRSHAPRATEPAASPAIPADPILQNNTWQNLLASRLAEKQSLEFLRAHNYAAAQTAAQAAIENNPNFYLPHALVARALYEQHQLPAAAEELKRALALDPPYTKHRTELQQLLKQCTP